MKKHDTLVDLNFDEKVLATELAAKNPDLEKKSGKESGSESPIAFLARDGFLNMVHVGGTLDDIAGLLAAWPEGSLTNSSGAVIALHGKGGLVERIKAIHKSSIVDFGITDKGKLRTALHLAAEKQFGTQQEQTEIRAKAAIPPPSSKKSHARYDLRASLDEKGKEKLDFFTLVNNLNNREFTSLEQFLSDPQVKVLCTAVAKYNNGRKPKEGGVVVSGENWARAAISVIETSGYFFKKKNVKRAEIFLIHDDVNKILIFNVRGTVEGLADALVG
jgi:hypothetical protein